MDVCYSIKKIKYSILTHCHAENYIFAVQYLYFVVFSSAYSLDYHLVSYMRLIYYYNPYNWVMLLQEQFAFDQMFDANVSIAVMMGVVLYKNGSTMMLNTPIHLNYL